MENKKLFLLDAFALIYRAYYALIRAPRITSKGLNTSAIFGFCNTLDEVLRKENPTHIAVCFDPPGPTFRHEMYDQYKAGREAQPEDITIAIPYIKRIIRAYNIPVIEVEGYEADDVIGTLSRMAEKKGYDTYMMTPDKDYGQLVTDHVWMYRPALRGEGFEIRGPKEICERYGISSPLQVIDLLALEGDASDNIPGCPGIGEKTAQKLIAAYHDVETMLGKAGEIPGAVGRKVRDNAGQISFSKTLATIKTDVPLDIDIDALVRTPEDIDALKEVYRELEFRTFLNRLNDRAASAKADTPKEEGLMGSLFDIENPDGSPSDILPAGDTLNGIAHSFTVVTDPAAVAAVVDRASKEERIGVDFYAIGDQAMTALWRGLAIAFADGDGFYIPVPEGKSRAELMGALNSLFGQGTVTIVSHDIKSDYLLLKREGIDWRADYFDTSVTHYILEPETGHRLPTVAARYLNYITIDYSDNVRSLRRYKPMETEDACELFCESALTALRLYEPLKGEIISRDQLPLLDDIELPLVRVLAEMEWTGARINADELHELSLRYTAQLTAMEEEVYRMAGRRFNIASPMQVGEILFGEMKIDPAAKKTKRGFYSTTEEILEKYRHTVPLVNLILKIRALRKLLVTYIDALPQLVNPATGKIHTTYNQTVTATGRISSANPNLQNIPIRSDDGREIRKAFIADPGCLFMSADYSQIELRLMADMSGDPDMVRAFNAGEDIHRSTAAKVYQVPIGDVTDSMRRNAKTANFGIIYGISAFGLSERLGIPRAEAKRLIEGYFASYPHIREFIDKQIEEAKERGFVTTLMGRKRYLPDINSRNSVVRSYAERNAVNAPLQGSAADIIKIAMINIYRHMEEAGLRSRMIMQVHDELIFNVVPEELERLQQIVTADMSDAYHGRVPLEVSAGVGANWLEAH